MDTNNTTSSFDPASIGARPYTEGAFDPTSIGARPYDPTNTNVDKIAAPLLGLSTAANEKLQQSQDEFASVSGVGHAIGDIAQGAVDTAVHPVKNIVNPAIKFISSALLSPIDIVRGLFGKAPINDNVGQFGAPSVNSIQGDAANNASDVYDQKMTPGSATLQTLSDTASGAGGVLGAGELSGLGKVGVKGLASSIESKGASAFVGDGMAQKLASKLFKTPEQISLNALNPDLSGKKLTNAYKQVVTGGREVTPSSIFREQGLTADQQTVNLNNRLNQNGIKLGKDPAQNLNTLKNSLDTIEKKLNTALEGDPEIKYNLDKNTLGNKLDTLKTDKPGDFIGDNGKIYDNVINYGKKVINDAEDSIKGGRTARTSFDNEAKRKFPSAYKNGQLDSSTPAGHAIKTVRDTINEHLYNTAPNGSEIQKLIGQEADIFRATENIAPKAASVHGATFAGRHPIIVSGAKKVGTGALLGAGADGAYEVGRRLAQ